MECMSEDLRTRPSASTEELAGFVARAEEEERQKEGKGELVQAAAVAFCKAAKQGNHTQERYLVSPLKCGKEKSNRNKKKVS